jgi:hypothetical protein
MVIVFGEVLLHQNKLVFGLNLFLKGLMFQSPINRVLLLHRALGFPAFARVERFNPLLTGSYFYTQILEIAVERILFYTRFNPLLVGSYFYTSKVVIQ